jgi:large-conductance mechanosensitive channel
MPEEPGTRWELAEDLPARLKDRREGMRETAVLALGPWQIQWGDFLAALINFIIIAFVVFLVAKYMFKEEKVTKK